MILKPITVLVGHYLLAVICCIIATIIFCLPKWWRLGYRTLIHVQCRVNNPAVLESDNQIHGEHRYIKLKDSRIKLHCVIGGPENGKLMLFLHSFPQCWYSWRHQLKEFSKEYRTVAVDLRGFGESDKPFGVSEYALEVVLSDIDKLIAALDHSSCVLVGHGWGAFIAMTFASLYPTRVSKVIAINGAHFSALHEHMRSSWSQYFRSCFMKLFLMPWFGEYMFLWDDADNIREILCGAHTGARPGTYTEQDIDVYKYVFNSYGDLQGPLNYYRAFCLFEQPEAQQKIPVPTLLIWGDKHLLYEKEIAEISCTYAAKCVLCTISDGSHWVHEERPSVVNRYISSFLRGRRKSSMRGSPENR